MRTNKNTFRRVLEFFGFLSLVIFIYHMLKIVNKNSDTSVISKDALNALQNPSTADKLREEVDSYHETGKWDKSKLESIL